MTPGPRVLTVISCGATKQELDDGETVPARELYTSSVHTCKDRYGGRSHGYYIASAKFGLVHNQTPLPYYDVTLADLSDEERRVWGLNVARKLRRLVFEAYDVVVFIAGKEYIEPVEVHFGEIDAAILTPWQTDEYVTGVGRGMSWCNDESNWPENVETVEEIGTVVSSR